MFAAAVPDPTFQRSLPRLGIFLSAVLEVESMTRAARIRNLSREGALVDIDVPPPVGTNAILRRGRLEIATTVVWTSGPRCGLRFDRPIALGAWAPALAARDQAALDERVDAARRSPAAPIPAAPAPDNLTARIAEELRFSQRQIGAALDQVASYPPAVSKLSDALQQLEVTAQALGHVATLLDADDPDAALCAIGLDELKRRLARR